MNHVTFFVCQKHISFFVYILIYVRFFTVQGWGRVYQKSTSPNGEITRTINFIIRQQTTLPLFQSEMNFVTN